MNLNKYKAISIAHGSPIAERDAVRGVAANRDHLRRAAAAQRAEAISAGLIRVPGSGGVYQRSETPQQRTLAAQGMRVKQLVNQLELRSRAAESVGNPRSISQASSKITAETAARVQARSLKLAQLEASIQKD